MDTLSKKTPRNSEVEFVLWRNVTHKVLVLDVFLNLEHVTHIKLILQALELFCRQQSTLLQNYMREVPHSVRKQSIVGIVARFSKQFYIYRTKQEPVFTFENMNIDFISDKAQIRKWRQVSFLLVN